MDVETMMKMMGLTMFIWKRGGEFKKWGSNPGVPSNSTTVLICFSES